MVVLVLRRLMAGSFAMGWTQPREPVLASPSAWTELRPRLTEPDRSPAIGVGSTPAAVGGR